LDGIVVAVAAAVGQLIKMVEAITRLNGLAGRLILRLYI
jgi:type III secretory pathway component EscS